MRFLLKRIETMAARTGKSGKPNPGKAMGTKRIKRTPLLALGPGGELTAEHYELGPRSALLGLFDLEIAEAFGIAKRTLTYWKNKFPKFREAIYRGKVVADAGVADLLFELAQKRMVPRKKVVSTGEGVEVVSYDELVEGDVRAATHILAARHPDKWALNWTRVSVEIDASTADAQEVAVAIFSQDIRNDKGDGVGDGRSVVAFLGIGRSSKGGWAAIGGGAISDRLSRALDGNLCGWSLTHFRQSATGAGYGYTSFSELRSLQKFLFLSI